MGAEVDMEFLGYVLGAWGATLGACMSYALYLMMRGRKLAESVTPSRRRWLSAAEEESKLKSESLQQPSEELAEEKLADVSAGENGPTSGLDVSAGEVGMSVDEPTSGLDVSADELLERVEAANGSAE